LRKHRPPAEDDDDAFFDDTPPSAELLRARATLAAVVTEAREDADDPVADVPTPEKPVVYTWKHVCEVLLRGQVTIAQARFRLESHLSNLRLQHGKWSDAERGRLARWIADNTACSNRHQMAAAVGTRNADQCYYKFLRIRGIVTDELCARIVQ
jgi:hypothetical protein